MVKSLRNITVRMRKLDNKGWQVWTALKFFYTRSRTDLIVGGVILGLLLGVLAFYPWEVKLLGGIVYAIYLIRIYKLASKQVTQIVAGCIKLNVSLNHTEIILTTPWEYEIELRNAAIAGGRIDG